MSTLRLVSFLTIFTAACTTAEPTEPRGEAAADGKADSALTGSCAVADSCGGKASGGSCYCDDACASHHDCCADAAPVCGVESNRLEDRVAGKQPLVDIGDVEIVASLPYPPGNVTVAPSGRTFISFFPDGNKGSFKIAELVDGQATAFPANQAVQDTLHAVLGLRADRHGRLWLLDHGTVGIHTPKLVAIDIATQAVVLQHELTSSQAGFGSLLNDLVISDDGQWIYISDLSPLAKKPAIVVVDLRGGTPVIKRRLEKHASVRNGAYDTFVDGREMKVKGIRPTQGVDGIALDASGTHLYYAALNSGELYRVPTSALQADSDAIAIGQVTKVADITMTDGMIADAAGRIYLTDMEHSALARVDTATGELEVVARGSKLRWPDGFSWAPDGSLYVTASALHTFLPKLIVTSSLIAQNGPYHVFRLPPP